MDFSSFIFLCLALIIAGLPRNPFVEGREKISTASHLLLVILAVWLITPGLSAMAGLSPYPPELKLSDGQYEIQIDDYEYPMPEEVSSIQGDYEEDVVFSVYIAQPISHEGDLPLAIILHGFAPRNHKNIPKPSKNGPKQSKTDHLPVMHLQGRLSQEILFSV